MSSVAIEQETYPMWIAGEPVTAAQSRRIEIPFDGMPVATVYEADPAIVERAITTALKASQAMRALTQYERAELLERIREGLKRNSAEFSRLVCWETGKPIREARAEVERSLQTLLQSADEARRLHGEVVPMEAAPIGKGRYAITVREPLGAIGAITPFNVPLNLALHKVAPALAAGNSVVHKPASNTPLSALRLARLVTEAGAPPGAYNVVTGGGRRVGSQIASDPRLAMVTFTGSVPVGEAIRASAGLRRVTLELGANSAVIIEPDADLDMIVPRCVTGSFSHSGQICISVQHIYVQERIADLFTERLVAGAKALKIGSPLEEATDISSLITVSEAERVERWTSEAVRRGAHILTGGKRERSTIEPTVLTDVPDDLDISCREAFGPVVIVHRYRELAAAIDEVNSSQYGLQAGVCTRDIGKAFDAARRLEVGGVMINDVPTFRADHMPYGGVKKSGIGREGPRYAIEEMTELKLICWRG
jgi:acyl-CoA reductase-like NAD-dependent aldehyde dehydrogenase